VAPEVSERLQGRREDVSARLRAEGAALGLLDQVSGPVVVRRDDRARGSTAWWLRADQRVVGFVDRPELARLRAWCDERSPGLALVTGAGGVGKTRLALRLAEELQDAGWLCRLVRPGGEAGAVGAARAVSAGPVLLIVDYAETREGLAGLLRAAAGDRGERLRVVLLARGAGEWWAQLGAYPDAEVRLLAETAELVRVGALAGGPVSGADLVRAAVPEFARAVKAPVPEVAEVVIPAGPVPILVLHAAALLAVLDARDRPRGGPVRMVADAEVLGGLLARERTFWLGSARTADLTGPSGADDVVAGQAVAVACLISADTEAEAVDALRRVPDLGGAPVGQLHRIARWLRDLYPPDRAGAVAEPRWWGSVQPDLLAERHAAGQLARAADFAASCLRELPARQATGALTVLARACAHRDEAPGLIAAALRADLAGLGVPAVGVAVQTGGSLGQILARVLGDADATLETLTGIEEAIPFPTVALADADLVLVQRIIEALPADADRAEIAWWKELLGVLLRQAGKSHQALPVTIEAVTAYRELAAASPDRYRPDLARSLNNLGVRYSELGRPADALPVTIEAVEIRRELAAASPDRYRPDLAASLNNLAAALSALERSTEAAAAQAEAEALRGES
jgi:tetratricopeptide (TPR) repeat protein